MSREIRTACTLTVPFRLITLAMACLLLYALPLPGQTPDGKDAGGTKKSLFLSAEDGWVDVSGFLDTKYGFLPIVIPITEPAVGYGAAVGAAFIDKPLASGRPDITVVGGMATQNGSWGALAGDSRTWMDNRLQTLAGAVYASINLDYYGIGKDSRLDDHPLKYTLEPKGGLLQGKYRIGDSHFLAGMAFAFATTDITFDKQDSPLLPEFRKESNVGGIGPSLTYDTRNNIFTPTTGTYAEATAGLFGQAFGGDDNFQRYQIIAMHFIPLPWDLYLGIRGQAAASFGSTPFYMRPFILMRGVPAMRYQGDEMAQIEMELRWQFWNRFSLIGFAGTGAAWNDFDRFKQKQSAFAGGAGFRYEIARKYGIHIGMDAAYGQDGAVIYVQFGSAWARP